MVHAPSPSRRCRLPTPRMCQSSSTSTTVRNCSECGRTSLFVELAPMIDVLFAGRGSMNTFFGIEGEHEEVMRAARTKLGVAACVLTRKKAKASRDLKLRSMAVGATDEFVQTPWRSVEIVDRLGGGDAFAGGFITGYLEDSQSPAPSVSDSPRAPSNTRCPAISSAPLAPRSRPPRLPMKSLFCNASGISNRSTAPQWEHIVRYRHWERRSRRSRIARAAASSRR